MKRCIIVGAGVAGIAAAVEAALQGMQVVLVESRRYLGGRARSFHDTTTGDEIDNGQHVLMGCYDNLRRVLRILGTEHLARQPHPVPLLFASPSGEQSWFNPYKLPGCVGVLEALLTMSAFSLTERIRLLAGTLRAMWGKATRGSTAYQLLLRCGQTTRLIERFWEPLVLATLNAPLEKADAQLLRTVLQRAFFGGGESHHLFIPRVGLSRLFEPLSEWLKQRGGELRLGVQATELVWWDDRVLGIATDDGEEIRGNAVIAAVPVRALKRLLPATMWNNYAPLDEWSTMPIVSVYLWYDQTIELPSVVGLWGTTSQWMFNRNMLVERPERSRKDFPGHVEVTISSAERLIHQSAESIAHHVWNELQQVFPQLCRCTLLHWRVLKEKNATYLFTPNAVEHRLPPHTACAGLYLAGDWTATGLPATLESAACSGIAAAHAALPN